MLRRIRALVYVFWCLSLLTFSVYRTSATPSTVIAIDPQLSTELFLTNFSVNITVTDIANFTSWQLNLYYLNSVLNCTNAIEGPFLSANGTFGTYLGYTINNNYNSTHGLLEAYDAIFGMNSVNGSGVILTVSFTAIGNGTSNLTLANTTLGDEKIPPHDIPHTDVSGAVNVPGGPHDIAVTNVTPYKTVIGRGCAANITVSVRNVGAYTDTFNLTVSANTTSIASQNVTLPNGYSTGITFTWNVPTGFAKDNYTIWAYAWPVLGETITANNNLTGGWVVVAIAGDLTGGSPNLLGFVPDGKVDMKDVAVVAKYFGQSVPTAPPNCDVSGSTPGVPDGKIDMRDVAYVARLFGTHDP